MPKTSTKLIDSRFLKVLSAKKADLKDSLVFICLDEDKFGRLDKAGLRRIASQIEAIEPDAVYIPVVKQMNVQIMDKSQFDNKDVLVTMSHPFPVSTQVESQIEDQMKQALPNAKSITIVHQNVAFS